MKRLIIASVVIVSIAALSLWGNRILERTLDAQLAPLLTKQLGLPVKLGPIKTRLLQLKASTPTLTMGDPNDPAVVATSVIVTLAWPDLLQGEVRLVYASANELMVRPSRWPTSDAPLPNSYRFLDPYLPRTLKLETGHYVDGDGHAYPVNQLQWQRHGNGRASADWIEKRTGGDIALGLQLKSLDDLLQLAPVAGEMTAKVDDKPDSDIALQIKVQPGDKHAYSLQLDLQAAGMTAQTVATGQTAWQLPDQSTTTMPLLEPKQLAALFRSYRPADPNDDLATQLAGAPPRLSLPAHRGHVVINEFRIKDEINKDTTFDVTTSKQGLQISALNSQGPAGILTGDLVINSSAEGWTVDMNAKLQAKDVGGGIAPQFVGSDWLLQTGRATIKGKGETWDTLLNSLQGDASAAGHYQGTVNTPVAFEAKLDERDGEFALDQIAITLGDSVLTGSAMLSGTEQRKLSVDLKGTNLDLDFLFDTDDAQPRPGMALPAYLVILPQLELNVVLDIAGLETPALSIGRGTATLERTAQGGKLVATAMGKDAGNINLTLKAVASANEPSTFQLSANFKDVDIPDMFRQQGFFYSRSSGSLNFQGQGDGIEEVFTAMRGTAKIALDVRSDNDWRRAPTSSEKLQFTGNSRLVIDKNRIVGVEIEKIDIDSIEQDLTGNLSVVAGRSPWLEADLESEQLNINSLLALLPESKGETDTDILSSLRRLGATQASVHIKALKLYEQPLSNVRVNVTSGSDIIAITQLDFLTENGALKSQAKMTWKNKQATLEGTAELSNVDLDPFVITSEDMEHVPVSGSAKLVSKGSDIGELLSNLTGYVDLQADSPKPGNAAQARRKLALTATRLSDGMQADITSLQWGDTDLRGKVRYYQTEPPLLEIEIHSGLISLMPWEESYLNEEDKKDKKKPKANSIGSLAKTSADFVGNVLLTPFRMLADDTDSKPGAKLFSSEPLPLDALKNFNMRMDVTLDSLVSNAVTVKKIKLNGSLEDGELAVKASSDELNEGSGELELKLSANTTPPTIKITSNFENIRGLVDRNTYPRSGFVSLSSHGQSEAELAANADGLVFLQLGKGPFDYANSVLLTSNLATTVFQTLIPGADRKQPELQCGITVALFEDGKGITPYGFAARTNQANLLGHIQIDLGKETLEMNLDSRGREGVGISVGSIFSNTIQIKGPLTHPGIVPDAVGLAWRGWAAVMTGGLSVLGESLVKRVLASENPCTSIQGMISKDLCPVNSIAASSPLVCPAN